MHVDESPLTVLKYPKNYIFLDLTKYFLCQNITKPCKLRKLMVTKVQYSCSQYMGVIKLKYFLVVPCMLVSLTEEMQ